MSINKFSSKKNAIVFSSIIVNIFFVFAVLSGKVSMQEFLIVYFLEIILSITIATTPYFFTYFRVRKKGRVAKFIAFIVLLITVLVAVCILGKSTLTLVFPEIILDQKTIFSWTVILLLGHLLPTVLRWPKTHERALTQMQTYLSQVMDQKYAQLIFLALCVGLLWAFENLIQEIPRNLYYNTLLIAYASLKVFTDTGIIRKAMKKEVF